MDAKEFSEWAAGLRLSHLHTFLCVADHLSYELAGVELGVDSTTISRRIDFLERALLTPLIITDGGISVMDDGETFIFIAIKALESIRAASSYVLAKSYEEHVDSLYNISIEDLWLFICLCGEPRRKVAMHRYDLTPTRISRALVRLENSLNSGPLFYSREVGVWEPTAKGVQILKVVNEAFASLANFKGEIRISYRPPPTESEKMMKSIIALQKIVPRQIREVEREMEKLDKSKKGKAAIELQRKDLVEEKVRLIKLDEMTTAARNVLSNHT